MSGDVAMITSLRPFDFEVFVDLQWGLLDPCHRLRPPLLQGTPAHVRLGVELNEIQRSTC